MLCGSCRIYRPQLSSSEFSQFSIKNSKKFKIQTRYIISLKCLLLLMLKLSTHLSLPKAQITQINEALVMPVFVLKINMIPIFNKLIRRQRIDEWVVQNVKATRSNDLTIVAHRRIAHFKYWSTVRAKRSSFFFNSLR